MSHNNAVATPKYKYVKKHGTTQQRRLANNVVEAIRSGKDYTNRELLIKSGYSEVKANSPSNVVERQGFQVELAKLGLTNELVVPMLVEDLKNNPNRRWLGLSIAGKWLRLEGKAEDSSASQKVLINNAQIIIQLPPKE